jgi:aspartyl protease family protein
MGQVLTQAAIWALIFLGTIAAYGLWPDIRQALLPTQAAVVSPEGRAVAVPRAMNGHYYLTLQINGAPVAFTVGHRASDLVLSREDARRAASDPDRLAYTGLGRHRQRHRAEPRPRVARQGRARRHRRPRRAAVVTDGDLDSSLLGLTYLHLFSRLGDRRRRDDPTR